MSGQATSAQLAAFLVLLRAKGETASELTGLAESMVRRAPAVTVGGRCVDIVGTGGDGAHTVNITTMAALVTAGAGRTVLKHGNRSASSLCGAADVLEKLGVVIDLGPADVERSVAQAGIGFCFAPVFHSGMRHAGPTRRELGIPTTFNVLGPLSNPGQPAAGAIGCAYPLIAPIMAQVFASRGQNALVFRGDDGLDEITTTTTSQVWTVVDGDPRQQEFDPESVGIARAGAEALRGGDPDFNAAVVHRVLAGESGPVRDAVLLNAAAAIAAFDDAPGDIHEVIAYRLPIAAAAIDTGAARELLAKWVSVTAALAAS
ncbi:MAG: trpD [Pseudonocardiales bacterium]|nr:trpD [Pseudonocardiales bacterium]